MAILKIARMGHPVLQAPADPVEDVSSPALARLIADMIETMREAPGVGLAAPQVYVPLRVVVFEVPAGRARAQADAAASAELDPTDGPVPLTVLINPVIEPLGLETALGMEACLSVPGLAGLVPRFTRIRYRGTGADGAPIERMASGFHARVVQHECDHLDGTLFPMRMADLRLLGYVEEVKRFPPAVLAPRAPEPPI
jgi:peptide deformylase